MDHGEYLEIHDLLNYVLKIDDVTEMLYGFFKKLLKYKINMAEDTT